MDSILSAELGVFSDILGIEKAFFGLQSGYLIDSRVSTCIKRYPKVREIFDGCNNPLAQAAGVSTLDLNTVTFTKYGGFVIDFLSEKEKSFFEELVCQHLKCTGSIGVFDNDVS
eukprot:Awhi_evm2s12280